MTDHCMHRCILRFAGARKHRLLGGSGGVVNSLDFCPASLKSLGYFRCILSSQWNLEGGDNEFANFTLPTLKTFLEACSQNVSGNKQ